MKYLMDTDHLSIADQAHIVSYRQETNRAELQN